MPKYHLNFLDDLGSVFGGGRSDASKLLNKHYKMHGFDITVSKDSYKEQDIDLQPGVHEGASRNISDSELVK